MGRLVVIEGLDGAGKRTLADGLHKELVAARASVGRLAFPRYGRSHAADLVSDALYGRMGDLSTSVHGMAVLYALDRADAATELAELRDRNDVVLLDRYVASNAAYGAARLHQDAGGGFVEWVRALEIGRLALPVPDRQLLLRVPPSVAAERSHGRERAEAERARDTFETDHRLQARCAAVYDELAAASWLSPWSTVDGSAAVDPAELAESLLA